MWSPISSTLIYGNRDAILVDPVTTVRQAAAPVEWVESFDRNLTTIYVTHGLGDQWFGLATIPERFPKARPVATPAVVEHMSKQMEPSFVESFWPPVPRPDPAPHRPAAPPHRRRRDHGR
ncbi:MBL fold metallo-hydrolase [Streptomyces botrytidirepellens]|uniref:MBL fold metallo-hydrolase n=2 Tax=Streptomyces botrytidirepellens TaxID=2486417 RepID=A0A3M8WH51_9ACTN|nr:MBL fold metallo-hydrolase [Streptomyces botrytidirepellens]